LRSEGGRGPPLSRRLLSEHHGRRGCAETLDRARAKYGPTMALTTCRFFIRERLAFGPDLEFRADLNDRAVRLHGCLARSRKKEAPESGGTRDSPEPGLDAVGSRFTQRLSTCDSAAQMYRQRSANLGCPSTGRPYASALGRCGYCSRRPSLARDREGAVLEQRALPFLPARPAAPPPRRTHRTPGPPHSVVQEARRASEARLVARFKDVADLWR
jgi:hypothetical protein